jgi:hypothetical protein
MIRVTPALSAQRSLFDYAASESVNVVVGISRDAGCAGERSASKRWLVPCAGQSPACCASCRAAASCARVALREVKRFAEVVNRVAARRVFAGAHQSSALHWVGLGQLSRRCHQGMRGSQCRNKTFPTARTISITDTSRSMLPRQRQNEPADATLSWSGPG